MRKLLMSAAALAAISLAWGQAWAEGPPAPPPPLAFSPPGIEDGAISPDGKHLALLGTGKDQMALNLIGLDDQTVKTLPLGDLDGTDTLWASSDYALIGALMKQTFKYDPQHRVYRYHRHVILKADGTVVGGVLKGNEESNLISDLPIRAFIGGAKPALIVEGLDLSTIGVGGQEFTRIRRRQNDFIKALYWVDLSTGVGRETEKGNQDTYGWQVDLAGESRVRFERDQNYTEKVFVRPKGGGWRQLFSTPKGEIEPAFYGYSDADDSILYGKTENGLVHVVRKSLKDGSETVLGPEEPSSRAGVVWDEYTETPVALTSRPNHVEWIDPQLKAAQATLGHAFKDKTVTLEGWSSDRNRMIFKVDAGDAPPIWYFYDNAHHEVSPIQEAYPALKGVAFGPKSFFTYKAADGLEIPAYLTLPQGAPATAGKLPLIVLPHGGPAAHDAPGFDYLSQFLASRGYAVLQPEFRGSTGFGDALYKAGHKEWGGKMQSDLLDGVKALAEKGVIDPSRVCIVGWSYGGYAALEGVARDPKAYKCAVSINGVTDLLIMTGDEVNTYGSDQSYDIKDELGDPSADGARMDAASPARHADRIEVPVLLVAGLDDTTVAYKQTDEMYKALQDSSRDVTLVTFKGDDHYLHNPADLVAMLQAVQDFLAKNLPVK